MTVATWDRLNPLDTNIPMPWSLGASLFDGLVDSWRDYRTSRGLAERSVAQDVHEGLVQIADELEHTDMFPALSAIVLEHDPAPRMRDYEVVHEEDAPADDGFGTSPQQIAKEAEQYTAIFDEELIDAAIVPEEWVRTATAPRIHRRRFSRTRLLARLAACAFMSWYHS
jgi:hypothetical protein